MALAFQAGKGESSSAMHRIPSQMIHVVISPAHNHSVELHADSMKAFDLCQTAASHVSALGKKNSPGFARILTVLIYPQSLSIMTISICAGAPLPCQLTYSTLESPM